MGTNLQRIMLLVAKDNIDTLVPHDTDEIKYNAIPENEKWRLGVVKEITESKFGELEIDGFTHYETVSILKYVCSA
jgi:hypothetical protein